MRETLFSRKTKIYIKNKTKMYINIYVLI